MGYQFLVIGKSDFDRVITKILVPYIY